MPAKSGESHRRYVLIAVVIACFIMIEWVSVFIFGNVPKGYP